MNIIETKNFKIYVFTDGFVAIDGGAMFGIVPKVFWEKHYPADEKNRVDIAVNCVLVENKFNSKKILIDTGIGNKFEQKHIEIYKIRKENHDLIKHFATLNLSPEDINIVINTHLHFDHCGYNTIFSDGELKPLFRKAKYFVQKKEYEYAFSPDERSKASYLQENFAPIKKHQIELINGNTEVEKGIKLIFTAAHSIGHQSVLIEDEDKKILFTGDVIPLAFNLKINYTSAFDLFPLDVIKIKRDLLNIAEKEDYILIFPHEIKYPYGKFSQLNENFFKKDCL